MKIGHIGIKWYQVVNMFIGQYTHHLEEKGRLSVPKKFRAELAEGAILSQGLDGCLFLYARRVWEQLISKVSQLPLTQSDARSFTRSLSYAAVEVDIDRLGRILIPEHLRAYAGLKTDCVVAGAVDRVEIWDQAKFSVYIQKITSQAETIAEKLVLT